MTLLIPRRLVTASILSLVVVGVSACGTDTLDRSEVEETISRQFRAQDVVLTKVTCGNDIEATVGARVTCTGMNQGGTKLFIEGKVTERSDKGARFAVRVARGEAPGRVVAAQAKALLEKEVGTPARGMTCPGTVDTPTKRPVRCVLTTEDGMRFGVTVGIDARNQLSAEVDEEPMGE